MTALPQGTVTFLFTDVEGSTRLLQKHGDRYADLLAEHRRVLRGAFARHGGVEVDTQGDAFFVAFGKASAALAAAADGRDALGRGPIRVRMGVHTGEPLVTDEGYVGIDVHRAARIAGAGHGGQIPLSWPGSPPRRESSSAQGCCGPPSRPKKRPGRSASGRTKETHMPHPSSRMQVSISTVD